MLAVDLMDQQPAKRSRGRPRKLSLESEPGTVQALDRGLQLLTHLAKERRVTLSTLAMQIDMPPSTAHRLLMTLQSHRFAKFDEHTQEWMVGVEAFRVGSGFLKQINLIEASNEVMQRLMSETGETANLAIVDGGDAVFVNQIETQNPIRAFFRPGTRSPMHASGAGKALLGQLSQSKVEAILQQKGLPQFTDKTLTKPEQLFVDLEESRRRGWAYDDEEHFEGMRCIAAPVFNAYADAVAGISVSGPTARFTETTMPEFCRAVVRAAKELTENLGGS